MAFRSPTRRVLPALLITLTLGACAVVPGPPAPVPDAPEAAALEAAALEAAGRTAEAGRLYLHMASRARGAQRIEFSLRGVELLLAESPVPEDEAQIEAALRELSAASLAPTERIRARTAAARLALWQGLPEEALAHLPEDIPDLPAHLVRQMEETRLEAHAARQDWMAVVDTHLRLEMWQTDPSDIEANRAALWSRMLALDRTELARLEADARSRVASGWLALALLARSTAPDRAALEQALERWSARYPDHPASPGQIQLLREQWAMLSRYPDTIAVLLPLSGRLGPVSTAVHEGLMAAYYALPADTRPVVRLYDTGEQAEAAWTLYQQAVADGAQLVIGPLDRQAVTLFSRAESLPVPVLALNHSIEPNIPEGLYQYGLNPEDEGRQAAEQAAMEGYLHALVLAPRNELGERLNRSFSERFTELGGLVLSTQYYAPQAADFAGPITQGLGLDASRGRHRQLQNLLRRALEFEPRRRQDLDVVFMVGTPRETRLLVPQIRFHRGGDLPVVSTSHAYDGSRDPRADEDLNGVMLADIPWLLGVQVAGAPGRDTLSPVLSGASRQMPRLVAMGHDAFRLVPLLEHLRTRPGERMAGLTGGLYLDDAGRVHRQLHWARFQRGELRPMAEPSPDTR